MNLNHKKYILFDNDGVLVETEQWYYEASKRALKEYFNYNIEFEKYMEIMTNGKGVWVVIPDATQKQIDQARDQRNIYYQEYLQSKNLVIDGVHEVLKKLSLNMQMGIVTTSRRVDFEMIHKNRGIVEYMDFVLCEGEYPKAKPYPDPYLKGLEIFGADPKEAVVVEDSQRGLHSAYDAKIDCVIVHNHFTKTQDFSKATLKIKNLKELVDLLN
jgi:HAD superfamily hydrolase (TIGR01509 family)